VRIEVHPCLTAWDTAEKKPKAYTLVHNELSRLSRVVGINFEDNATMSLRGDANGNTPLALYQAVQKLSNEDLDRLNSLLVLLSFGQADVETLDTEDSLFNRLAADQDLVMRDWWTPDAEFLALMRKDQLEVVALESGASLRMGKLKGYSKKELVNALTRHFERTADPAAMLEEHDQKGRAWLPGAMCFPARVAVTMADPH
jgi:ParB family chromosome partitioning protein